MRFKKSAIMEEIASYMSLDRLKSVLLTEHCEKVFLKDFNFTDGKRRA